MDPSTIILSNEEIDNLLETVIAEENIIDPVKEASSGYNKGDGFMSFWTMVTIKGTNKQIDLAIKCAPKSPTHRDIAPVRAIFLREIYFYEVVYPALLDFQKERATVFTSVPKCYKTSSENCNEILVLDNIKTLGFKLWNCKYPMDDNHLRLTLKEYANLHAVSFAMKDQRPAVFSSLVKDMPELVTRDMVTNVHQGITNGVDKIIKLKQGNERLCDALVAFKESIYDFMQRLADQDGYFGIILHGDCWSNNRMFCYEDTSKPDVPTKVNIIDFQVARVGSAAMDISSIIYLSGGKRALVDFDKYLQFYYDSLSDAVASLGSDLRKLYSMDTFMEEWKVWGRYGFMIACLGIHMMLREEDERFGIEDVNKDLFNKLSTVKHANEDEANRRLCELAEHVYERGFI